MHELVRPNHLPTGESLFFSPPGKSLTWKYFICQKWDICSKEKGENNLFESKENIAVPVSTVKRACSRNYESPISWCHGENDKGSEVSSHWVFRGC